MFCCGCGMTPPFCIPGGGWPMDGPGGGPPRYTLLGTPYILAGWGCAGVWPYRARIESLVNLSDPPSGCFWLKKFSSSALAVSLVGGATEETMLGAVLVVLAWLAGAARNSPKGSELSGLVPFMDKASIWFGKKKKKIKIKIKWTSL